ncbi:hypothetical protein [Streptomyces sp. NPDC047000]|uniref:hypothetical protein n=1 Tax=Streptomyces sp. NPDC047000 TaxID=3155474 RepID=UPI0034004AFC
MNRLARIAGRLADGSAVTARRLGARLTAWVARGRRDDLTGWRAALGCWARLIALILGLYLLWRLVRAVPALMWPITGAWTIAAWRAGKPTPEAERQPAEETPVEPTETVPGEAMRALLLDLMGTGSAVHLSTVLDHLQQQPDTAALTASWEISDLRSQLGALSIPVHPKVKAAGRGPTRGVRREDLAPSPAVAEETSTAPSTAV